MKDDEQIAEFVDRVEEVWIRLGLESEERRRLVDELVIDLAVARSAGADTGDLVRADVVGFAVEVAAADGHELASRQPRPEVSGLIATAFVGAVAGAVLSWYVVYMNETLIDLLLPAVPELAYAVLVHTMAASLALAGVAFAIWLRYRHQPRILSIAIRTAGWAAVGGLVSLAPAVALAARMDYRWGVTIVLLETLLVGSCVAAAIALGNRLRPFATTPLPQS